MDDDGTAVRGSMGGVNDIASSPSAAHPQTLAAAMAAGPVVLDGGMSNELERAGCDLSSALWSAQVLASTPGAVRAVHEGYFAAGARVAITASYQASFEGFADAGLDRAAAVRLMHRSVEVAAEARTARGLDGQAWVAASVGPYGAVLAGGQEYTGAYAAVRGGRPGPGELDLAALRAFHRPRLETLLDAHPDLLALETVPSALEAEALLLEVSRLGAPAWLSLTLVLDDDGRVRTRRGEDPTDVLALAGSLDEVVAVGVNCTDVAAATAAVPVAARSGRPVVVYPNSGETWDGASRTWTGPGTFAAAQVQAWVDGGARLVGGCCRVGREDVAAVAAVLTPGV